VPENPETEGSRLITLKQIESDHGVSRSALHTYRRSSTFPQPIAVEGSTKTLYRADEVAAWFQANPKQQGKKRERFLTQQQGDPVTTTTARERLSETLTSPGLVGLDVEQAAELLDAYRAAVLREAAQRLYTALFPAVYDDMGQKAAEGVNRAVSELRRLADEQPEAQDG